MSSGHIWSSVGWCCLFSIGIIIITNQVNPWPIHHHCASCRPPIGRLRHVQCFDWLIVTKPDPDISLIVPILTVTQRCYYKMTHTKEIRIYCKNIYFTKDWMECLSRNELNNQALSLLEALQFSFRLCIKFSIESTRITLNKSLSIGHCSQQRLILFFTQKLPSHTLSSHSYLFD